MRNQIEDRTQLLHRLAKRWRLVGNDAEVVAKAKIRNFFRPFALTSRSVPDISLLKPARSDGWLIKRMGGAGGTHIRSASRIQQHPR